jgi:hypothetical protein
MRFTFSNQMGSYSSYDALNCQEINVLSEAVAGEDVSYDGPLPKPLPRCGEGLLIIRTWVVWVLGQLGCVGSSVR